MEVAGTDLGPGVGDADDRLVQVFFAKANAAEVRAGSGAGWAFGEDDAVGFAGAWVAQFFSESYGALAILLLWARSKAFLGAFCRRTGIMNMDDAPRAMFLAIN